MRGRRFSVVIISVKWPVFSSHQDMHFPWYRVYVRWGSILPLSKNNCYRELLRCSSNLKVHYQIALHIYCEKYFMKPRNGTHWFHSIAFHVITFSILTFTPWFYNFKQCITLVFLFKGCEVLQLILRNLTIRYSPINPSKIAKCSSACDVRGLPQCLSSFRAFGPFLDCWTTQTETILALNTQYPAMNLTLTHSFCLQKYDTAWTSGLEYFQ
jgi:hypothetical protein